jgi:hypothetical protein
VTRLFRDDVEHGVSHREAEGRWDQVLVGAYREWRRAGLPAVTVYVRSLSRVIPEKAAVPDLVRELVNFAASRLPPPDGSASFERDWTSWPRSTTLPHGVAAVEIRRRSHQDQANWFMPRAGMVPDLSVRLLQKRIGVKNARFAKYSSPPSENWLLIIAEGTFPSSTLTFVPDAIGACLRVCVLQDLSFRVVQPARL